MFPLANYSKESFLHSIFRKGTVREYLPGYRQSRAHIETNNLLKSITVKAGLEPGHKCFV